MVHFLSGASAVVLVWQQFAAAADAASSVPLQAGASLPSQLCNEGAEGTLPSSSGVLRAGHFQCTEHIMCSSACLGCLKITHSSPCFPGVWETGKAHDLWVGGLVAETEISQVQQG